MKRKTVRQENQTRKLSVLVTITLFVILVILLGVCVGVYQYRSQFSPEKWQRAPGRRAFIVGDFLEDHPPEGLTEDEVRGLLGAPDLEENTGDELRLGYVLGNVRTVLDAEWLVLELEDGVVTQYLIETGLDST